MTTDPRRIPPANTPSTDVRPSVPEMDLDRFDRLMTIAGPTHAAELLFRLKTDLECVQDRLVGALALPDWTDIRSQTHILVALAGAVGAVRLQHLADELNRLAHSADVTGLPDATGTLLADIDALIQFVGSHLARVDG